MHICIAEIKSVVASINNGVVQSPLILYIVGGPFIHYTSRWTDSLHVHVRQSQHGIRT